MSKSSEYTMIHDVSLLSHLVSDIQKIALGEDVSRIASLDALPVMEAWCPTLVTMMGIIGQTGAEHPASMISKPIFAMSVKDGWARTLDGWVRLGRPISEVL